MWGSVTDKNYGTIHYGLPHEEDQGIVTANGSDFAEVFHTFALEWLPGKISWYLDGKKYYTSKSEWYSAEEDGTKYPFPAPFDHDFYVILNLACGNNWAGYPDPDTQVDGKEFLIDYVRVYQKEV